MSRKIVCVVGTRPEAVKLAPVIHRLRREESGLACRVIATGQHRGLLDRALADFDLAADRDLDLMKPGQSLAELTGRALVALSQCLAEEQPDLVLAVGDTTTVLATALACHYERIAFGHVEAGLRTGEAYRPFPEEKNRELAARLAAVHFAPTMTARNNLLREGIAPDSIHVTGNTVIDALARVRREGIRLSFNPPGERFVLVTAHRRENWGEPMRRIAAALRDLVDRDSTLGLVIPAHPNPEVRTPLMRALGDHPRVLLIEPLGYPEFVAAMAASAVILTDSGGVQEEGPALGKPVVVLRPETERPEALGQWSCLVGTDREKIVKTVEFYLNQTFAYDNGTVVSPYGDGRAAERIARVIAKRLGTDVGSPEESPPCWPPAD
jgi:UDP-N-acetylglucosamine 2-epimerase (non-hydrolysing)